MKLAILGSRGFPSTYGGYETLVRYLARDWTQRGHEVTVYCRTRDEGRRTWLTEGVRCIWTPGHDSKSLSTLSFGATSHIDAAIRGYDAALVLNVANGFYLPLLRARGIPTVVNTDGIEWERGKWGVTARRVFYLGASLTARHADTLVADSQAIAKIWRQLFSVRSRFIPYGADVLEDIGEDRIAELGLTARYYILVVARLIPENNVELVLDALDMLPNDTPAVIVGSANYESQLEERLRDLDHRGRLQWLGHVSDQALLTQLWAHSGAYVHGHSVGGTNPGLLQALGAGAPTLALDTEFNREVLGSDEQLFGPEPRELALRLEELLDGDEIQRRFSEHGRAVIVERYSWDDVSSSYLETLEEVCHHRLHGVRRSHR
jgi:glycosyltransferase involved in cell wall biosynthesis